MYKIALLGVENSHADAFLKCIRDDAKYSDIEVVGTYTDDPDAALRIKEAFGFDNADGPDAFVGKVDGIIITARHGDNHYKYAAPYIPSGIPMFIDKPYTCDPDEAVKFVSELKSHGCRVTGGSSCVNAPLVKELKAGVESGEYGKVYGGFLRAPVSLKNNYGNFFFYCQHLSEVIQSIFGYYPKSVRAEKCENVITVNVKYDSYTVTAEYVDGNYTYYASVSAENGVFGGSYPVTEELYPTELDGFCRLLRGGEQLMPYEQMLIVVNFFNAINASLESGKEEAVLPPAQI